MNGATESIEPAASRWPTIVKHPGGAVVAPNLGDYAEACAEFTGDGARSALDGLPGGLGLNIAHEAVDRHVSGRRAEHVALRRLGPNGEVRDITYRTLSDSTNRFANVLDAFGVRAGGHVCFLGVRTSIPMDFPNLVTAGSTT